ACRLRLAHLPRPAQRHHLHAMQLLLTHAGLHRASRAEEAPTYRTFLLCYHRTLRRCCDTVTRCIDPRRSTCSNVGLFEVVAFGRLLCSRTIPAGRSSLPPQPGTPPGVKHETHVPTVEDPSCAHARLSRPHEDGRRPQGSVGAPREGPHAAFGLTGVETHRR